MNQFKPAIIYLRPMYLPKLRLKKLDLIKLRIGLDIIVHGAVLLHSLNVKEWKTSDERMQGRRTENNTLSGKKQKQKQKQKNKNKNKTKKPPGNSRICWLKKS